MTFPSVLAFRWAHGDAPSNARVIGNGFDLEAHRPDPEANGVLRLRLGLTDDLRYEARGA